MRFALLADIHAGISRGDVGKRRLGELVLEPFKKALEKFSDVDYLVIAGDLIDDPKVSPKIFNEILDALASFPNEIVFVSGNHDLPKVEWKNSLIHALKHLKNVHYYDISRVIRRIKSNQPPVDEISNLKVLLLPYPSLSKHLHRQRREAIYQYYIDAMRNADYDLVIGHLSFERVSWSNELTSDFYLPPGELKSPALMGHIHSFRLSEKYAYAEAMVPVPEARRKESLKPLPARFYTVIFEDGRMQKTEIPGVHYVSVPIAAESHIMKSKGVLDEILSLVERAFVDIRYKASIPSYYIDNLISRLERKYGDRITIRRRVMVGREVTIEDILSEDSTERLVPLELIKEGINSRKVGESELKELKSVLIKELSRGLPEDEEELQEMAERIVKELLGE